MGKEENEILRIKYTQNIPFPKARKIEATKYADVSKKNIPNISIPSLIIVGVFYGVLHF